MKFHLGSFPQFENFQPDSSWNLYDNKKKSIWIRRLKALPIGMMNICFLSIILLLITYVSGWIKNISFPISIIEFIICLIGVNFVHELLRVVFHPKVGLSSRTIIGFWPSRLLLYSSYNGDLNRNRYIAGLIIPNIILFFSPLVIAIITKTLHPWMVYVPIVSGLLSGNDIQTLITIIELPPYISIRNQGGNMYYKDDLLE